MTSQRHPGRSSRAPRRLGRGESPGYLTHPPRPPDPPATAGTHGLRIYNNAVLRLRRNSVTMCRSAVSFSASDGVSSFFCCRRRFTRFSAALSAPEQAIASNGGGESTDTVQFTWPPPTGQVSLTRNQRRARAIKVASPSVASNAVAVPKGTKRDDSRLDQLHTATFIETCPCFIPLGVRVRSISRNEQVLG